MRRALHPDEASRGDPRRKPPDNGRNLLRNDECSEAHEGHGTLQSGPGANAGPLGANEC